MAPPTGRSQTQHLGLIGGLRVVVSFSVWSLRRSTGHLSRMKPRPSTSKARRRPPSAGEAVAAVCVFAEDVRWFTRVRSLVVVLCGVDVDVVAVIIVSELLKNKDKRNVGQLETVKANSEQASVGG